MRKLKELARWFTPYGVIEARRRNLRLQRHGFPPDMEFEQAITACNYDLWPPELKARQKPWNLVDVGANEGEFASAAIKLGNVESVYAFEPQPGCQPMLMKNLSKAPSAKVFPNAVGESEGELELNCTVNSRMASLLAPTATIDKAYGAGNFEVANRLKVPVVTLDDALPHDHPIGLLKIDVQGYEIPVLRGARQVLKSTFAVLMEVNYVAHYEQGATFDDVHEQMRSLGFRTFAISAPYDGPTGPLWADAMFVKA